MQLQGSTTVGRGAVAEGDHFAVRSRQNDSFLIGGEGEGGRNVPFGNRLQRTTHSTPVLLGVWPTLNTRQVLHGMSNEGFVHTRIPQRVAIIALYSARIREMLTDLPRVRPRDETFSRTVFKIGGGISLLYEKRNAAHEWWRFSLGHFCDKNDLKALYDRLHS